MNTRVTILGCGPAGLLVAHAAEQKGCDIRIISEGSPSPIGGAQYLHEHVPGLTDEDGFDMLTYVKVGTEQGYAAKAYGEPEAQVSWDMFVTGDYPAWSLKQTYQKLWRRYGPMVEQKQILPVDVGGLCREADLVFSSIPLKALCRDSRHEFGGQEVVFTEEPYVKVPNLIVYNGRLSDPWYRAACLFGYSSTEYALGNGFDIPNLDGLRTYRGIKPVYTDCDCHLEHPNFIRVGRFGRWRRGVLTNHAYDAAVERMY